MSRLPFAPLPSPEEMAAWDRASVERFGVPHEMLMENAAREALHALLAETGPVEGKRVLLVAGPGNNGGDAIALARHLHDLGAETSLVCLRPRERYLGPSALHFDLAVAAGVPMRVLPEAWKRGTSHGVPAEGAPASPDSSSARSDDADAAGEILDALWPRRDALPDIIVDGLLGTGFHGELSPFYGRLVETLNTLRSLRPDGLLLALDIPSGLDGLTGRVGPSVATNSCGKGGPAEAGETRGQVAPNGPGQAHGAVGSVDANESASASAAIRADLTVSFEAAKPGLVLPEAAPYVGRLVVRRIGVPRLVREQSPPARHLLDESIFRLLPQADPLLHKGSAGHLLVVGGSRGLTGAPLLAALAGLRAGAGLVTLACPGAVAAEVKAGHPDVMTLPMGDGAWFDAACADAVAAELGRFDAVIVGPGLGRRPEVGEFLAALLPRLDKPQLLDADGLYWLAQRPELCGLLKPATVLTPHPGEMARLMDRSIGDVQADRQTAAMTFADKTGTTLVLKGAGTLVAESGGRLCVCPIADPLLAVAGSGDVLSGVIGSLLARGLAPLPAACLGVYWHGFCGETLRTRFGAGRGALASDIASALPDALAALISRKDRPKDYA